MDRNNFFDFLNKLSDELKLFLLILLIGVALCVVGGVACGIPAGICQFNFMPVGIILCIVGALIILLALLFALA